MKKVISALAVWLMLPLCILAQQSISGVVTDAASRLPLVGANIVLSNYKTVSDANGKFSIADVKEGSYALKVSFIGYQAYSQNLDVKNGVPVAEINVALNAGMQLSEAVVVSATRANEKSAMAYTNFSKEEIATQNIGQDLPYIVSFTPSVVSSSDAGAGVGYTNMRVRGSDITRTNITLNGVPMNEAESHLVFFVNLPDLASSVDNIQIQRGLGTSSNGSGAFGASMNIQTSTLQPEAYAEVNNTYGSFNTWKHTAKFGSGLLKNGWAFDARLSKITSDGYMDRGSSDLKSFYTSAAYYGKKSILKFIVMSGKETTYQAWNGVPESRVKGDTAAMRAYIERNSLSAEDAKNLLNSGRTYNSFTYKNQTDNYQQDYYQIHYTKELSPVWNLNLSGHYTKGGGYYEELRLDQKLSSYKLANVVVGSDTIRNTDLVRRRWLQTDYYGLTYSTNYQASEKLNFVLGGGLYGYQGKHFGEVIWAKYASNGFTGHRFYENNAEKQDFNTYFKTYYTPTQNLDVYLDLQQRYVNYSFLGYDRNLASVQQEVAFNFLNPKIGLTYRVGENHTAYASFGIGNKEPNRDDLINSSPSSRPTHETLRNLEAGYRYVSGDLSLSANYFLMNYQNQLVLTGKINDVGEYTRTNIARSYRTGLETEIAWNFAKQWRWSANLTLSQNKVQDFNEYLFDYATEEEQKISYKKTDIAFSPNVIGASLLSYSPLKGLAISWQQKYVGAQYLDNTQSSSRKLDAYWLNDLRVQYTVLSSFAKEIQINALVANVLNLEYSSNGYTYGYAYDGQRTDENFLFPQAGRNFLLGVNIRF